jgi:hypothetical protein
MEKYMSKKLASSGEQEVPNENPAEVSTPVENVAEHSEFGPIGELFSPNAATASDDELKSIANRHLSWELSKTEISKTHNVIVLYNPGALVRYDADRIYGALTKVAPERPILLIIDSRGGDVAAAYFIAKLCRESTSAAFEVAVPRQAKSAATLICCGADRIHMGSLSELGPIDPQFGSVPALALKHSIEHIAQLAASYPAAQEVFSTYLSRSLDIQALGYYERVAASAVQYAERLLASRLLVGTLKEGASEIAHRLVYAYKDHGFAIDSREAMEIFGTEIVQCNTLAYDASNQIYGALTLLEWMMGRFGRSFSFIGSSEDGCWVAKKASPQ